MRAILDHVGIAVRDLEAALAFYRDALGLEIDPPVQIDSEKVRASFVPVGEARLELLEPTAPDSTIAKFVDRRGPGLHHITLRVENIGAALAHLAARGARLVEDRPRTGAENALVAFVHPSSAHGVLVELKQLAGGRVAAHTAPVMRCTIGDLELISVCDGYFRLDGGSMFGVVPKPLWERRAPPDSRNRITLAMRPLVVRGSRTMIVDAGLGDKENDKFCEIYGVDRRHHLDHALAEAGLTPEDIDVVLATHLHFDHAGGFTRRDASGRVRPRFPRAQYIVRRGEWEDATHPHERNRASYLPDNYVPLAEAGVLQLLDEDGTIMPGVSVRRTGGHTRHHQMVVIESGGRRAAFVADLIPTQAHVGEAWIMGYDLYPMETLAAKKAFMDEAAREQTIIFFEHDPLIAAGYIGGREGRRTVAPFEAGARQP
jgi:methylmalonyl-CoA epimerase